MRNAETNVGAFVRRVTVTYSFDAKQLDYIEHLSAQESYVGGALKHIGLRGVQVVTQFGVDLRVSVSILASLVGSTQTVDSSISSQASQRVHLVRLELKQIDRIVDRYLFNPNYFECVRGFCLFLVI